MFKKLISYIKDSKTELKKVAWPTKKETKSHTLLVIGICVGVAIFLGLVDYIFSFILGKIVG